MYKSLNNNNQKFFIWLIQIRNASKSTIYNKKQPNYYEVLGVSRQATSKELKLAYYKKCQQLHPDKNKDDPQSHQKFVVLNQAYSTLIDPNTRTKYDLNSSPNKPVYSNPSQYTYYNNEYYSRNNYYHDYYADRMREEKMRYDAHYRRYYQYPNSEQNFKTPTRVIFLVFAITITIFMFDALFINYTYQKDMNQMHQYYSYSPLDKMAQKELKKKLEKKLSKQDEDEIDEQIRHFKEYDETPNLRVYKSEPVQKD